ncbi:MAG: lactamase [Chloroflexi bacterium]|nr:lactamase [Chloroflexota bacterium]
MEISWYGHSCFRITERGMPTVVTDPFDHEVAGYAALKLKGDIVTVSHDAPGHNFIKAAKGNQWELSGPGEYEIGGVFITGVAAGGKKGERNMVYVIDHGSVTVAHFGDMQEVPTQAQVEALGTVNVALVPVGGGNGMNAARAAEVVSLIEPGIVVPMHYKTKASKPNLEPLSRFLQEMGISADEKAEDSLKVTASSVPTETQVVVLNPRS